MNRLCEILAPVATIASLTVLAMIPPTWAHIVELEARVTAQRTQMKLYETFVVNCLSGRILVVDRVDAVECVKW